MSSQCQGAPRKKESLNKQLALLLVGLCLAFAFLSFATQRLAVLPVFGSIEHEGAERDIMRCVGALGRDIELLSDLTNDWAAWTDTYVYIEERNADYEESNLLDESFTGTQLNMIAMFDTKGELIWGEGRDLETEEETFFPEVFAAVLDPSKALTVYKDFDDAKEGVMLTDQGPMLIAIRPIITSKREGPIRGSLAMGRLLTGDEIANLAERAQVDLNVWTTGDEDMPETERALLAGGVGESDKPMIQPGGDETLQAFQVFPDLCGNPALVLRVDVPRTITAQGKTAAFVATSTSIVGGLLMVAVAGWLIRRRVVTPVQLIAAHASRIGEEDNLKSRIGYGRSDEIGELAAAFDEMVRAIAESRQQLLETAHRAGMADVASEVLHNVGNAVNSANASLEKLEERVSGSKLEGLEKANALLQSQSASAVEFFGQDSRGPMLIDYFATVTGALQRENTENRNSLGRLRETIRHIQGIIAQQQANSRSTEFVQDVDFGKLIEEVLGLNQEQIGALGIEVDAQVAGVPELNLQKGKLSQILVNIIRNAVESMSAQDGPRLLTILAAPVEGNGLCIEIRDTGAGIPESIQSSIFNQGFTTKPEGNGIGLHFCANAVQSMGGQIALRSEGTDRGAAFQIWLPGVVPVAAEEGSQENSSVNHGGESLPLEQAA